MHARRVSSPAALPKTETKPLCHNSPEHSGRVSKKEQMISELLLRERDKIKKFQCKIILNFLRKAT